MKGAAVPQARPLVRAWHKATVSHIAPIWRNQPRVMQAARRVSRAAGLGYAVF